MIAVIADDFTGAAEIGGLGLRYGLKVKIETEVVDNQEIDLMIIATDTRSMNPSDAAKIVANITDRLIKINPEFIFKKTDSVMRGHILSELTEFMKVTGESNLVLVSANPSLGRKIIGKEYFINGIPLQQTGFANDPDFPAKTSNVCDLLGFPKEINISLGTVSQETLPEGIIVAESKDEEELKIWSSKLKDKHIYAGAAGHFVSILEQRGYKANQANVPNVDLNNKKCVYVSGSAIDTSRKIIDVVKTKGTFVCEMPEDIIFNKGNHELHMAEWLKEIEKNIKYNSKVIIAINKPLIKEADISKKLREYTADIVSKIFQIERIDELMIEGGATAYAIIQRCGFKEFNPVLELSHGVLRMQVEGRKDFTLTLKPGSYSWPNIIWDF